MAETQAVIALVSLSRKSDLRLENTRVKYKKQLYFLGNFDCEHIRVSG